MLDIAKEYVQVNGREALDRLLEGEAVYSVESCLVLKVIDDVLCDRDYSIRDNFTESSIGLSAFLDPNYNDWYIKPPFDARKELLERPGEWVAKYTTFGKWYYIGFDLDEMVAIQTDNMKNEVDYNDDNVDLVHSYGIKNAVALDKEDLKFLADYKNK